MMEVNHGGALRTPSASPSVKDRGQIPPSDLVVVAPSSSPALLHTKLTPPRVADAFALLVRPRLVERIQESSQERLILVCAPAGYGKTTLVAQAVGGGVAWLSLDDRDNDPGRFVAYLVGALQRANPTIGSTSPRDRPGSDAGVPWAVLESALNDLVHATETTTLVIDDYHRINNPVVHQMVGHLVDFLPPRLRLVLASRIDPPLPLARLRARGELLEIRAEDLSFTRQETVQFLAIESEGRFPPGLVSSVQARTEGWVVALQLLKLLIRGEPERRRTAILQGFVGRRRHVAEYLLEEVLRQQPPLRRTFLLHTSILARLTGPLCDAVTEQVDGQAVLHALEREGMLLFGLDDQRRWYRYHHLLAELLVQQLIDEIGEDGAALLHRRASAWLGDHDLIDDAIDHSLAANDWQRAVDLMHRAGLEATAFRRTRTLRRWLEALPAPVRETDPMLAFWYGRTLSSTCQPRQARALLERAEQTWIDAGERHLAGSARVARAWGAIHEGRTEDALALAEGAVESNAASSTSAWAASLYTHGVTLARVGRAREALAMIGRASAEHPLPTIASVELGQVMALAGRFAEAAKTIQLGLANDNPTDSHRRGHIWLADIYRAWNDLDRADEQLERAEDLAYFFEAESFFPSLEIARARLLWATGKTELAFAELALGIERSRLAGVEAATREAEVVRAGFWLEQGRLGDAAAWSLGAGLRPDALPDYPRLEEQLVYARFLSAGGHPDLALPLLARLRLAAEEDGRVVDAGRLLVVEAVARQAQNQHDAASHLLTEAIARLEPSGHIRCFADEGDALIGPLRAVAAAGAHLDFVGELLKATGHRPPAPVATGGLIDPLSNRELEVLRLVSVGLSNREISDQLFISVPTVKRHVSTILEKLAAQSRTQAVSVARSLQLI